MSVQKRILMLVAAVIIMSGVTEFLEQMDVKGVPAFISTAEAVVGRPLTPVSVAGVARRSTRRCAAGVTC